MINKNIKIITIEGTDSSGKGTQSKILKENLEILGLNTKVISFPNYEAKSSIKIKRYLAGDLPNATPRQVAKFYSDDRYYTFANNLIDLNGIDVLIIDRYTGSNFIHQCSKLDDTMEKVDFINDFLAYEYDSLGLPKPSLELFLDMPREHADILMEARGRSDIHENDKPYLEKCYQDAKWVAEYLKWITIPCTEDNELLDIDEISEDILFVVGNALNIEGAL